MGVLKTVAVFFFLVFVFNEINASTISPGEQAQVTVTLEELHNNVKRASKFLDLHSASSNVVLKVTYGLKMVIPLLSAFSTTCNIIFTFVMPSQLDVIKEEFDKVNQRLDDISDQVTRLGEELKSSIEFNAWHQSYIDWEFAIRNGGEELRKTMEKLSSASSERDQMKIATVFIDYYLRNDIEGKLDNIDRITGMHETVTTSNLMSLFIREKGCDEEAFGNLITLIITDIVISANKQKVAYLIFKGSHENVLRRSLEKVDDMVYRINKRFTDHLWDCRRDMKMITRKKVAKIMEQYRDGDEQAMSRRVYQSVSINQRYEWAVLFYDNTDFPNLRWRREHECFQRPCDADYITVLGKGQSYIQVENSRAKVAVIWQDSKKGLQSCNEIAEAETVVFFTSCDGCLVTMSTSAPMLTKKRCPNALKDMVERTGEIERSAGTQKWIDHLSSYDFIAGQLHSFSNNPCRNESACNGRGRCKIIPFTDSYMCVCGEPYIGQHCEHYLNTTLTNVYIDTIEDLRRHTARITGVPTIVDVYYDMRTVVKKLDELKDYVHASNSYTSFLVLFGDAFTNAEKIVIKYADVTSGNITLGEFTQSIERNEHPNAISHLRNVVTGTYGFSKYFGDHFTVFKTALNFDDKEKCTQSYSAHVQHMIEYILFLDAFVSESWLTYAYALVQSAGDDFDSDIRRAQDSKHRRSSYKEFWSRKSCPPLVIEDADQAFCKQYDSYEGMTVEITCKNNKVPTTPVVTCEARGNYGMLSWSNAPQCVFIWGAWSEWSSCSQTCSQYAPDGPGSVGIRERVRSKPNGDREVSSEECNTQDCCHQQCPSGRCISEDLKCDGEKHCPDGSDELQCSYLRDGNRISLKVDRHYKFLSCYCTVNCGDGVYCRAKECREKTWNWKDCVYGSETFIIARTDGVRDGAIVSGQKVALRYYYSWNWLSCWPGRGKRCTTRSCPGGSFDANDGHCDGEIFRIHAKEGRKHGLIANWDMIALQYSWDSTASDTGYWLTADRGHHIKTKPCPGYSMSSREWDSCKHEVWKLYVH